MYDCNVLNTNTKHIFRPDTASYIQKLEREREAREKGDLKDNRSFLAKYVSYLLLIDNIIIIITCSSHIQLTTYLFIIHNDMLHKNLMETFLFFSGCILFPSLYL